MAEPHAMDPVTIDLAVASARDRLAPYEIDCLIDFAGIERRDVCWGAAMPGEPCANCDGSGKQIRTEQMAEEAKLGVTYKHKKSGRMYEVICNAVMEGDHTPVVVYRQLLQFSAEMKHPWVRPLSEFLEKFEDIDTPPNVSTKEGRL